MAKKGGSCCVTGLVLMVILLAAFPALGALTGPFLGPPPGATPGEVDTSGANQAYPQLSSGTLGDTTIDIYFQSPWSGCQSGAADFTVTATRNAGTGIYDTFSHYGRSIVFDQKDADGKIIGGTYAGGRRWPNDAGTILLVKSGGTGQTAYDRVSLVGTRQENGVKKNVSWVLDFVEQNNQIAVQNIAQLGVINPCTQGGADVDANSQIWLPLGTGDDGQPRIILDINGDGTADDPYFGVSPAVSGVVGPPIPTLTEWGLGMLTVLFLILGLRYSRNRNSSVFA